MPQVSGVGVGQTYTTLAAWVAAESGSDYGVGNPAIAEVTGSLGAGATVNGVFVRGFIIRAKTGEELNASNLSGASANGPIIMASTTASSACVVKDITYESSFNFGVAGNEITNCQLTASSGTAIVLGARNVIGTGLIFTGNPERCFDSSGGAGQTAVLNNCLSLGVTGSFSFVRGTFTNCLKLGGGTGYAASLTGSDHNASDDTTAPGANSLQNRTTADLVNFAGGDYRTASGSVLATAGLGGTFIGFALESSSGISLTVDSGTYSQAGNNTPLKAELNILTTSGSYLLTGSDVNLKAAKKLIAETGSYNLTGTDVTLIYTPGGGGEILVIDSGVYSLAGDELLLNAQLNIVSNSGNYLLSGTETRIAYNANIVTDTGSYSLTGSNVNLFANYGMIVQSTSYTLTGTSVTLKYSGDTNQIIGTVTAGFAPDLYSVGYKPNTITVTFKE